MDLLTDFATTFITQFQKPTLAFLIGGMVIAALGSRLEIPDAIYRFIVFMLLMKVGLKAGLEIRHADPTELLLPAIIATATGCAIVIVGRWSLAYLPGIKADDAIATGGLFGAVSASTLAAAMIVLESDEIFYEAWVPALYPFMDIPALVLAIVMARLYFKKKQGESRDAKVWPVIVESLRGSALSALLLGMVLGLLTRPEQVLETFYEPLFRGLLSILMLIMGMEAYARLAELRRVAHWYAVYALIAPIMHGVMAFALGVVAHHLTGFSPGGVILLSVMAASSSDISGPPTLRAGIPTANPSAFIGTSTSVGTPVAVAICIPLFIALANIVFDV